MPELEAVLGEMGDFELADGDRAYYFDAYSRIRQALTALGVGNELASE